MANISKSPAFASLCYAPDDAFCSWQGWQMNAGQSLDAFLTGKVQKRLIDHDHVQVFESDLQALELTGMGSDALAKFLKSGKVDDCAWASGEALAEGFLQECFEVIFPWNMRRDKRTPLASLPGADLLGFVVEDGQTVFAFGEVKTSSDLNTPPHVMHGRGGMSHQLDRLAHNSDIQYQAISWLRARIKATALEPQYRQAAIAFFNSAMKKVSLFGVLVRDTVPNPLDLSGRGQALREKMNAETHCQLIALYLPMPLASLKEQITRRPPP